MADNTRYGTDYARRRAWNRTAGRPIMDSIAYPIRNLVFHSFPPAHQSALEMVQKSGQKHQMPQQNHNGTIGGLLADNRHCHYSHIAKRSRRYTLGPITLSGRYFIQHFGIMSPDQSPEVSTESLLPRKVKALPPPLEVEISASLKYILFLIL